MSDPNPAAGRAYTHVKTRILSGDLAGGTLVSEVQVGMELGLSRTPVHEAFLRLDAERLLTLSSRKGAVITPISPREARNVLEMREAVEATAARRMVEDGSTDKTLPALASVLERQRVHAAEGDVDRFVAADEEFHSLVIDGSGNDIAAQFYAQLRDRQQRLRHLLLRLRPGDLAGACGDHEHLADALAKSDADEYARVLHAHMARYEGAL
ncbi:GntR family transcriptional regulator [Planotetraspora thailandica]|uniref:GntR family transcriptional regulator n=1 Tax=Planotetraspora thailandica TaxID=487172 RepID=A0A8J3VFW2_9ACTN|nr:GntR family transcriptional regulator [Planotetraspora thailandica]GII57840.1 GntR family transcriptional regulator [Planotetraspora thailandica]